MRTLIALTAFAGLMAALGTAAPAPDGETVGRRPYELEWANRAQDDHPPLVDFEDLTGWRVECKDAVATLARTREQQIWDRYVGKLTYRRDGTNPEIRVVPPEPIPIAAPFDTVTLWVYGNNWGYAPDPATPPVGISVLFEDAQGQEFSVYLYHVDWTEWYLLHRRLDLAQIARARQGARFKGILITGGRNREDRALFFDNLAVFVERMDPLSFEPRPKRGIPMFPGQSVGTNTGPGKLPFPTRLETILPGNLTPRFRTSVRAQGDGYLFTYEGADGRLTYRFQPQTGTLTDIVARWAGRGGQIRPCVGGGVYLNTPGGPAAPERVQHLGTRMQGKAVVSRWRVQAGGVSTVVAYTLRLWGKSLVVDVVAPGGAVAEVRYGRAVGLEAPRLVTNPFYPAEGGRPAVAVAGRPDAPLFLTGNTDWYLSNASVMWATNQVADTGVVYNGGTRYIPKTDGRRNDCYERLFITLSPRYEEMLPVIPNPRSPWKHITGTRVWRAHGAGNREADARFWSDCHRWGMTQVVVTDHETGWRDGGESFTFRTRPAPGKGGDKGQYDYARLMQDRLGFIYGPYNNFTDFAPVNEFWSTDLISRTPDGQLQHAWMRCYAPKPARAVEYAARLPFIIEKKFRFSTAYCDVHTAVAPWHRVDYDARVPGAGTFAAVFYAYGEIMLLQKKAWGGPVYSEGNHHCFYSGLTDGNYGQDQAYRPAENPWLVDFDLRGMHDLCCNFGMGNLEMFYANVPQPSGTPEQRDATVDRFLAATVAFGHPGFLVFEGGIHNALRSYYMLQQLHSRYCLASAAEIRYVASDGRLLDTSAAVASGAYKRSQVVTRYTDGTVTAANGSPTQRLVTTAYGRGLDLPPNGYCGWTRDGAIEVWSGDRGGRRCDYAATPAYLYVDGRGRFVRFARAASSGQGICRLLPGGKFEVIPVAGADCGFAVPARTAVALDKQGKVMGPARLRVARGLTYVVPIKGAFSYLLSGGRARGRAGVPARPALTCSRTEVIAGEQVTVRGRTAHVVRVPGNARPGERIWVQREGGWIDFTVVPLADTALSLAENQVRLRLASNLPRTARFTVALPDREQHLNLAPGRPATITFDLGEPTEESAAPLVLDIRAGRLAQRVEAGMRVERRTASLARLPEKWTTGMCVRGGVEQPDFGQTGAFVERRRSSAGEVTREGLFMHPPWMGAVGYTFALSEPVMLPPGRRVAFRAVVGKADGSDLGDGILYRLIVVDGRGTETVLAKKTVTQHEWLPIEGDLSPWAGQRVRIKLISDVGPADNSSGDWACWADMRIETAEPILFRTLDPATEAYRRVRGPFPIPGLTVEDLRTARAGWLRYDGKGLEGPSGEHATFGVLNGVELGPMAAAGGNEVAGTWAERVGVPLTPEAIRSLGRWNRFVLRNPKRDWFAVRRFWIELELADGRRCSSDITAATFSQPPEWTYSEGIGVPFPDDITVDIWFGR